MNAVPTQKPQLSNTSYKLLRNRGIPFRVPRTWALMQIIAGDVIIRSQNQVFVVLENVVSDT